MKKFIGVLIVFSFLFIGDTVFSALLIPGCDSCNCVGNGGVYENNTCYYFCSFGSTVGRFTSKNYQYEQCKLEEKVYKEKEEAEAIQKTYNERKETLSQYSDFFVKVGVNLTLDTNEEQYNQWLKELKEKKADYIKEQENLQKIKELEERINTLESKPVIVEKVVTPIEIINTRHKEDVTEPKTNNKIIEPIVKKEEPKIEIIEEKLSPIIETTTTETPVIPTNKSFFQKVFSWFNSLF